MTRSTANGVPRAVEKLEAALASNPLGRETEWAGDVRQALALVEQAIRRNTRAERDGNGPVTTIEQAAAETSPRLDREIERLLQEGMRLLDCVSVLQGEVQQSQRELRTLAGSGKEGAVRAICDLVVELLHALRGHQEAENKLVQETVNTDIGAGD